MSFPMTLEGHLGTQTAPQNNYRKNVALLSPIKINENVWAKVCTVVYHRKYC